MKITKADEREKSAMKPIWKWSYVGIILLLIVTAALYVKEYQENQRYEAYLSQELSNTYHAVIGNILDARELLNETGNQAESSDAATELGLYFNDIAQNAQRLDYYLTQFEGADNSRLSNKTAAEAEKWSYYYQTLDVNQISNAVAATDKGQAKALVDDWVEVITRHYPELSGDQLHVDDYAISQSKAFFKQKKWRDILIGLDQASIPGAHP